MKIGKLKEVELREVWAHEQYGFSNWLATEDNIKQLSEVLELDLVEIETEQSVGKFKCDIICKEQFSGKTVIIENQLEKTNHDHLGKTITYASGLDAKIIIWIVKEAQDEHASAIEWLNKYTDEDIAFFLVEVHAFRIGDSEPAPNFRIIQQPNNFVKNIKSIQKDKTPSALNLNWIDFWTKLNEYVEMNGNIFKKRKPTPSHWYNVAIGSSKCFISIELINSKNKIAVKLYIPDNKDLYNHLCEQQKFIEEELPYDLEWYNSVKKSSYINANINGLDFKNKDNYSELMQQIVDMVAKFKKCFMKIIKK